MFTKLIYMNRVVILFLLVSFCGGSTDPTPAQSQQEQQSQESTTQNNSEQSLLASPPFPFVVDSSIPPSTPISNLPLTQTEGIQSAATSATAPGATAAPGAAAGNPQTPFGNVPPIEQTYTPTPACVPP